MSIALRYNAAMGKRQTSVRLTPEARDLLLQLADAMGLSKTAVIELAIRALARRVMLSPEEAQEGR